VSDIKKIPTLPTYLLIHPSQTFPNDEIRCNVSDAVLEFYYTGVY